MSFSRYADLQHTIKQAFQQRTYPEVLSGNYYLSGDERKELDRFSNRHWSEITIEDVKKTGDAIFHFSGEAFCFFLPGFMTTGITSGNSEFLVYEAIIGQLDRTPAMENWDDHFISRWTLLTPPEITATQEWLLWLLETSEDQIDNVINRSFDTLELLRLQKEPPEQL